MSLLSMSTTFPCRLALMFAVLAPGPIWADLADDQFAVAAGHYQRQRWKMAVDEFQAFLQKHPNHPKANQSVFYLAEALLQSGRSAEAETHFREYLDREPSGRFARPALFRAGETAYLGGKPDRAKAELQRFREKYPNHKLNAYVLPYLGDIVLRKKDAAAAARYFRAGLSQFPQGRLLNDCRFGLARALERQGQNAEAERLYLAVAASPDNPLADYAQFHLGALQYATAKYAESIETFAAFETVLAKSSWRCNARLGRGWALLKLDRPEEAASVFESIISDPKVGIEGRYWLGMTQRREKDWAAAAKTLLAAAAAAPGHELIHAIGFYAGDALLQAGDAAAAAEQFDMVIASGSPGNEWIDDAMHGKVQAALCAKDFATLDRTAAEFDERFPQSPLKADVHRKLAQSLMSRNRHGKAVELLEAVGMSHRLDHLLAVAYEGLKRHNDALAVLLPVLDSATGRLKEDSQLVHGSLLVAMQRYADAVEPLEAFLAAKPTGDAAVKGRGALAICYARTDRLERAKQIYAELLEKHPEHRLIVPLTEPLAEAAYQAKDTQWSAELFKRLKAHSGSNEENQLKGLSGLGWSQFEAGELAKAAATFEELLNKDPPANMAAEAALVRGRALEQLGQSDPALAMFELVIGKYPQTEPHVEALLAAARLRDRLEQNDRAAALYERLTKDHPKFGRLDAVLYDWAWTLHDLGRADESDKLFERLRNEHPNSRYWADATYRLAWRAFQAKDRDRAGKLAAELLAAAPSGGDVPCPTDGQDARIREHALYLRGQIAVAEEDWQRAREAFETLLEDCPESPRKLVAEYWIAETTYRSGDYDAAGRRFARLAQQARPRREPWLAMVPLRRAQVLARQKKWTEAHAIASGIEAEYPHFQQQYEADYLVGRYLHSQADLEGARKMFRKVINSTTGEKTETAAMAQWMIGETYFHQKEYRAALDEYLRLEILYAYPTWQAAALLQAGKCRELLDQRKEAERLYARILKVYQNTSFAEKADRRLQALRSQKAGTGGRD